MTNKDIKYINKDFSSLKEALIDYAKTYFPDTYNDFSPSSPGSMFIDMAAYVGDVLSFYQDNQIQENFLQYAKEKENLLTLAYMLGYNPKITSAASATVDIYQQIPSIISASQYVPDYNYCMILNEGTQIRSSVNSDLYFFINDKVDFSVSSSLNPTETTIYSTVSNHPNYYLLKKQAKAISGQMKSMEVSFGAPEKFPTVTINDNKIIQIVSIIDSDGNKWYEVPYLAQETIFEKVENNSTNNPYYAPYKDNTPYMLKLKKVPRRFTTRFKSDETLEIQFGSGILGISDEVILPNTDNVGSGLINSLSKMNISYDPSNFLYTSTYGIAPSNTTLTINYLVGGGIESNAAANTLNSLISSSISFNGVGLDSSISEYCINSLVFNNPAAAVGGKDGDTIEEIRLNSISSFPTQLRAITKEDYIVRTLSLPQEYGSVSKAYISQNDLNNPLALNLYVLSYNASSQLSLASEALKQNIKTYLSQYRMLTDAINIKDAFIVNIGVQFDITVLPGFNSKIVLYNCIQVLKDFFNIKKWQINQPILISEMYPILSYVDGVQSIQNIQLTNKVGESLGYSKYGYDIKGATKNNIVYPSLDPCIFEVKYPDVDIVGRVTNV